MKTKKQILGLLLIALMVPSMAFASWWNPLSWKIFNKKQTIPKEEIEKNYEAKINELQKQIEELKNQQSNSSLLLMKDEVKTQVEKELKIKMEQNALATREKTLSEKVGVSRESLSSCIKSTKTGELQTKISTSVESAMKALPREQRGTPYVVIIGSNGVRSEVRGAVSFEEIKKVVEEVKADKVTTEYKGEISLQESGDHLWGSQNAQVKMIEYSDLECPYCKYFQEVMKKVVDESSGNVSWVYRHWPIHQNSFEKLVAAECVAKLKGNEAFWKYVDLIFEMLEPSQNTITDKL